MPRYAVSCYARHFRHDADATIFRHYLLPEAAFAIFAADALFSAAVVVLLRCVAHTYYQRHSIQHACQAIRVIITTLNTEAHTRTSLGAQQLRC